MKTYSNFCCLFLGFFFFTEVSAGLSKQPSHRLKEFKEASETAKIRGEYPQWFTGPLIALTPITMDVHHPTIEPSLSLTKEYGIYDNRGKFKKTDSLWSLQPFIDFQFAVNSLIGFEILASTSSNFCKGASSTYLDDTSAFVGFQVSHDHDDSWIPDFRILFQEIFPTGKYDKLSKSKHLTDLTGQGAFSTGVNLITQKLFHLKNNHKLCLEASIGYLVPSAVHVKGLNYYGGNKHTNAKVYPGGFFNAYFVAQYSFSRTWGITLENIYTQGLKGRRANPQENPDLFLPRYYQFSLAPEIQHTLSPNLGLILGGWATVLGKNSVAFAQGFFALLYIF